MEKDPQENPVPQNPGDNSDNFNANNAYSGSGAMSPGGDTGEAGKLSDYPGGNLDDVSSLTENIPGAIDDETEIDNESNVDDDDSLSDK